MRTFVALDLPPAVRERVEQLIEALRQTTDSVRWTRTDGLHITLKFIGEVAPAAVEAVREELAAAATTPPFRVEVRGAGFFPNDRSPRVLWLGVQAEPEAGVLARNIDERLERLGIPKEERAFSPHITLGRVRGNNKLLALREVLRQNEPLEFGSFFADSFYLYESVLTPAGSVYRKIARFALTRPEPRGSVEPGD